MLFHNQSQIFCRFSLDFSLFGPRTSSVYRKTCSSACHTDTDEQNQMCEIVTIVMNNNQKIRITINAAETNNVS